MQRKICLVGQATRSREYANQLSNDWEIWGQNTAHGFLKRSTRWFQIHPKDWNRFEREKNDLPPDGYGRAASHVEWLAQCGVPVFMKMPDPRIPTSVRYPLPEITEAIGLDLGHGKRLYLNSTTDYMLAMVLWEHLAYKQVDVLSMAGIEMQIGHEYAEQKASAEHWLGRIIQAGIAYDPPLEVGLLKSKQYAIETDRPSWQFKPEFREKFGDVYGDG